MPAVNPTVQEFNYPLSATIPDSVNFVRLVITGLNDSPNEFMTVSRIFFCLGGLDSDGDGIRNADEVIMNTRLDDPLDVLRLSPSHVPQNENLILFPTKTGSYYRLYVSDDQQAPDAPLQVWRDAGRSTFSGNDSIQSFRMDLTQPVRRFYLLMVQRADADWPTVTP